MIVPPCLRIRAAGGGFGAAQGILAHGGRRWHRGATDPERKIGRERCRTLPAECSTG